MTPARPEYGEVGPPWWDDRTVYLVGGGPSLRGFDFGRLIGRGIICGVNQAMLDLPECHAGVSIDRKFVHWNQGRLAALARGGLALYLALGLQWRDYLIPGAAHLNSGGSEPLSLRSNSLRRTTSGLAALNLAVLKQARRIVLLGFDYGAISGRDHYHDAYHWVGPGDYQPWADWVREFDRASPLLKQRGIEVVNASPESRINCFPKMSIDAALEWARGQ